MIDFKVPRAEDCVLIDTKRWIQNNLGGLTVHKMSGRGIPTYTAKVISVYPKKEIFKEVIKNEDTVLLTRVASEIAGYKSFEVEVGDKRYFNIPIMQVIGVFSNDKISLDSLTLLFDKILIKKIDTREVSGIILPDSNTMIGEVVKTGTCSFDKEWNKKELAVKKGDIVLVRDNVSTEVTLNDEVYFATEESMVMGIFRAKPYTLENLEVIGENIIMESFISPNAFNTDLLTPSLNFEEEDITDFYNRDLFKVLKVNENLTQVKKDDILLLDRNITNYVYVGLDKYFTVSGLVDVSAKVK